MVRKQFFIDYQQRKYNPTGQRNNYSNFESNLKHLPTVVHCSCKRVAQLYLPFKNITVFEVIRVNLDNILLETCNLLASLFSKGFLNKLTLCFTSCSFVKLLAYLGESQSI